MVQGDSDDYVRLRFIWKTMMLDVANCIQLKLMQTSARVCTLHCVRTHHEYGEEKHRAIIAQSHCSGSRIRTRDESHSFPMHCITSNCGYFGQLHAVKPKKNENKPNKENNNIWRNRLSDTEL